MLEQAVYEILSGDSTIAGYVGTRIRPEVGDELGLRPFITYQVENGEAPGTMTAPGEYKKAIVEVDVCTDLKLDAIAIGQALVTLLNYKAFTKTNCRIAPFALDDDSDVTEGYEAGTNKKIYMRTQRYRVLYRNF